MGEYNSPNRISNPPCGLYYFHHVLNTLPLKKRIDTPHASFLEFVLFLEIHIRLLLNLYGIYICSAKLNMEYKYIYSRERGNKSNYS